MDVAGLIHYFDYYSSGTRPVGYWTSVVRIPKDLGLRGPVYCTKNFLASRGSRLLRSRHPDQLLNESVGGLGCKREIDPGWLRGLSLRMHGNRLKIKMLTRDASLDGYEDFQNDSWKDYLEPPLDNPKHGWFFDTTPDQDPPG